MAQRYDFNTRIIVKKYKFIVNKPFKKNKRDFL